MTVVYNTLLNDSVGGIVYFLILLLIIIVALTVLICVLYGLYTLYQRYKLPHIKVYSVPDTLSTSIELDETGILTKGKKQHANALSNALYRHFLLPSKYKPANFSWPTLYFYKIEMSTNSDLIRAEKKALRFLIYISFFIHSRTRSYNSYIHSTYTLTHTLHQLIHSNTHTLSSPHYFYLSFPNPLGRNPMYIYQSKFEHKVR